MREPTIQQERNAVTAAQVETAVIGDPTIDDPEGVGRALVHHDVQPALQLVRQSSLLDDAEIGQAFRLAKSLAQSGLYKGVEDAELTATQAFAKILVGRDLGLSPTRSLATIDIVRGNAQLRGVLLAAFIRESDNYDYEILEHDDEHAKVEFWGISKRTKEWKVLGTTTFTVQQAKDKGIWSAKKPWGTWPENMCIWRCISNGIKFWMGDLLGGMPAYSEADSFEDRRANVGGGIGGGNGTGEGPGWQGLDSKQISLVESLIERAERLGHMGFQKESVQVRLGLKTPAEVEAYIKEGTFILDGMEAEARAAAEKAKGTVESTATEVTVEPTATKVTSTNARTDTSGGEERGYEAARDQGVPDRPQDPPSIRTARSLLVGLGVMHVVDQPTTNRREYHHEHPDCGTRYGVPFDSGTAPVEGQVVDCLECGGQIPVGTYRVNPAPADPDVDPDELEKQGLDLMAQSDALAESNPEESTRLAERAHDLHEQAVVLRGSDEPDTLPGF